jgi:hypothetical protein
MGPALGLMSPSQSREHATLAVDDTAESVGLKRGLRSGDSSLRVMASPTTLELFFNTEADIQALP